MISSETDRHSGRRDRDYVAVFSIAAVKQEEEKALPSSASITTQKPLGFTDSKPATWTFTQLELL